MKKMIKQALTAAILSAILLISPQASIAEPSGHGNPRQMFKDLNLTQEQNEKMKKLHEAEKQKHTSHKKEMKVAHEKMKKLMTGDATEAELRNQFRAIEKMRAKLHADRFENMLAIRAILTPQQRKEMGKLMKRHMEKKHGGKGRHN